MKKKAALFWSGGKDSAYTLFKIIQQGKFNVVLLITTLNTEYKRVSMHGIREELLDRQATATGIRLQKMWVANEPTNEAYERELHKTLSGLKSSGIDHVIFGDIFLEDLKKYRDDILKKYGLKGIYPLWKQNTTKQIHSFLSLGFRTVICCISTTHLDKSWIGKEISETSLIKLPKKVDPCGENGEFHTFCFDGPCFNMPVDFQTGEERFVAMNVKKEDQEEEKGFWYIDLL